MSTHAPIASREYEVAGYEPLTIMIFAPRFDSGGASWFCDYAISGPLTKHEGTSGGVDAIQALIATIYGLRGYLELTEEHQRGLLALDGFKGFFDLPEARFHPRNPGIPPGYAGGPEAA